MKCELEGTYFKILRLNFKYRIKFKYLLLISITTTVLSCNLPSTAQTVSKEDIITRLKNGETNELNYRIGLQTYPINYIDDVTSNPVGFCANFANALEEKLNEKYRKKSEEQITIKEIEYEQLDDPRFNSVSKKFDDSADKEIHFQCGSDTKRTKDNDIFYIDETQSIGVIFSDVFLKTGMKILVKEEQAKELSLNDLSFGDIKIGLIKNSTTSLVFETTYRRANIKETYLTRDKAIEGLKKDEIDAFTADDIILQGILKEEFNNQGYIIFPKNRFLSDEPYAIVMHPDDRELIAITNNIIEQEKDNLLNYLKQEGYNLSPSNQFFDYTKGIVGLIFAIITIPIIIFVIWKLWKHKNKTSSVYFEYLQNDFNFVAFISTLKEINYNQDIPLKIEVNTLSNTPEKFSVNFSVPHNMHQKQFENEFRRKYERNKNRNKNDLSKQDSNTQKLRRLEDNLIDFIEKTNYREISIIFNLAESINNNSNRDTIKQTGNIGIGHMSGNIQDNVKVAGVINEQDLDMIASKIKTLLKQLEEANSTNTTNE